MKKYRVFGVAICTAAALLTGCGETVPDLTPDQQTQITEYAVDTLLKYSRYGGSRLQVIEESEETVETVEEPVTEEPEETEEPAEEEQPWLEEPAEETEEDTEAEPVYSTVAMQDFMGLHGVSMEYTGYKITDAYPIDSENAYFSVAARKGKKLLVLEFAMTNTGMDPAAVDLNRVDVNYAFADNGGAKYKLQHTMVENDLYGFSGNLEAGETKTIAGIVEMDANEAENVSIPTLTMTRGDERETILLH